MDVIVFVITAGVGLIIGLAAAFIWDEQIRPRLQSPRLNSLLKFAHDSEVLIIYPTREPGRPEPVLPDMSIEDFMAIYNLQRLLTPAGWSQDNMKVKDTKNWNPPSDEQQNLILVCAPWRNEITKRAFSALSDTLLEPAGISMGQVEHLGVKRPQIVFREGVWTSPTFDDIAKIKNTSGAVEEGPLTDYALIVSASRGSWQGHGSVLIIAGLRGIGTWGAANHLRRNARELARRAGRRGFALLVSVRYLRYDIAETKEVILVSFD